MNDHETFGRYAWKGHNPGWWDGSKFTPAPAGVRYQERCERSVQRRAWRTFVDAGGLWTVGR